MMNPITVDEFELKLVEFLHGLTFSLQEPEVQERLKEFLGVDPEAIMEVEPQELDMDRVHMIAVYLMQEEELAGDIPSDATDETDIGLHIALRCGLFIYGWEDYRIGEA